MTLNNALIYFSLVQFQEILPGFCGFHDVNLNNLEILVHLPDESLSHNSRGSYEKRKGSKYLGKPEEIDFQYDLEVDSAQCSLSSLCKVACVALELLVLQSLENP